MHLLIILGIIATYASAQKWTISTDIVKMYIADDKLSEVDNLDLMIAVEETNEGFYKFTVSYADSSPQHFQLKPLDPESFKSKAKLAFEKVFGKIGKKPTQEDIINKYLTELYTNIAVYLRTNEEIPQVATVSIRNFQINMYSKFEKEDSKTAASVDKKTAISEETKTTAIVDKTTVASVETKKATTEDNKTATSEDTKTTATSGKIKKVTTGDTIKVATGDRKQETTIYKLLHISNVNLTFFDGYIEKVQVLGYIKFGEQEIPIEFNNGFSIGISSTRNVNNLSNIRLFSNIKFSVSDIRKMAEYAYNISAGVKAMSDNQVSTDNSRKELYIILAEFLNYEKTLDVNANDISPVPVKVNLSSENPKQKLFRERTTQLFEAKLYTDLLGLIDEENPNGIVQLELDKRFNFKTTRTDWMRGGIGVFQYIDAIFNLSKIEADNKYLIPPLFSNSLMLPVFHPIQLYQYRNYSVGAMLNLVNYENQNIKYNLMIDVGLLFGRTGIKTDTTEFANKFFINNMEIPFETGFHFIPEKRVKLIITDRISWFKQLSDDLELPLNDDGKAKTAAWLNTVAMKLEVNTSDNGKLFARYKFIHEIGAWQNNFSQLQFGYSFYILKNNGVNKVLSNN